jgi:hypothetical protein
MLTRTVSIVLCTVRGLATVPRHKAERVRRLCVCMKGSCGSMNAWACSVVDNPVQRRNKCDVTDIYWIFNGIGCDSQGSDSSRLQPISKPLKFVGIR